MVSPNIEIDVGKDKVVATAAPYRVSLSNVEVEEPTSSGTNARIEIPERRRQEAVDSDGSDYAFLANPKKLMAPKEIPLPTSTKDAEDQNLDSDSGRSHHSARSWKSHHSSGSHKSHHTARSKRSERSEYRPRYSMPQEPVRVSGSSSSPPMVNSLFSSGLFSRRTHAMTEDDIRREKSYLLQQFQSKNRNQQYSPKRFSMDSPLEEIQNELQFIISKREMENSMKTWKQSFLMCAETIVQLNTTYDPFNFKVDLSDWAVDLNYDVNTDGKYDEVLEELITKWRGKMPMSPEMKLLFMMGSSLVYGVMTKKKEAAYLAKRMDADRKMEQRIDAAVEKKFASKMREHLQQQAAATEHMRRQPPAAAYRPMSVPPRAPPMAPSAPVRPSSPLQGPSLSHADLMKIMGSDIIESAAETDDDDTSTLSSESTMTKDDEDTMSIAMTTPASASKETAQVNLSSNNGNSNGGDSTTLKVTKPRAKAATKVKVTQQKREDDDEDEDDEDAAVAVAVKKPAAKRAAATAGGPVRGRGRPRKNAQPNATVVTLENFS